MKKSILVFLLIISICLDVNSKCSAKDIPANTSENGNAPDLRVGESYQISIGDILNIQVYQEEDLSGDFEVKGDGAITYPLLGPVKVAGLTKSAVEVMLTQLLAKDYLVNPYINMTVKTYHQRNVMVLGCVQKPGAYSFPENNSLTLMKSIALAGGFTGYAEVGGTKIIRTSADGNKQAINPHVTDIMNGRKQDVDLEPNDLIMVPERLF